MTRDNTARGIDTGQDYIRLSLKHSLLPKKFDSEKSSNLFEWKTNAAKLAEAS